ncbi:MAG TPA: response regulator, partial [Candidatus Nitrosotalea sp.]|nr:response regulator [Candidatus Nitrosotalea sp.]
MDKDLEKFDLACTYLKNDQNGVAHNLFTSLAQKEMKNNSYKAGLYLILASECKSRQGKDRKEELLEAAKFYLKIAKKDTTNANYAYQCAARCFLRTGHYDEAMEAFEAAQQFIPKIIEETRSIVVVDDSPAILLRIKNFLQQLGYDEIQTVSDGKSAINLVSKLVKSKQNPIVLLDMDLPDMTGDEVAKTLLKSKPDMSIILITADEKSTPRVRKTIGLGSTA